MIPVYSEDDLGGIEGYHHPVFQELYKKYRDGGDASDAKDFKDFLIILTI